MNLQIDAKLVTTYRAIINYIQPDTFHLYFCGQKLLVLLSVF